MEYRIRQATSQDASAITALIRRVRINPNHLDWQRFWLAVDSQDRLLGCGQIKPHNDGTFELASLAVQPEAQGQGIGQALMAHLLANSPRPLYLICRARLLTYYQPFGFREVLPTEVTPSFRATWRIFSILKRTHFEGLQGRIMIKQ